MTTYVIDASVALKWFTDEDYAEQARKLQDDLYQLVAPGLFWPECGNILWKKTQRQELTVEEARIIRKGLEEQPIKIISSSILTEAAMEIAFDKGVAVYDGCYVALAILCDCKLVTADRKLVSSLLYSKYAKHILWIANL